VTEEVFNKLKIEQTRDKWMIDGINYSRSKTSISDMDNNVIAIAMMAAMIGYYFNEYSIICNDSE
jgi:hypothetical protein